MLTKCANPECPTAFNYFNQGRLFEFDYDPERESCVNPREARRISHFRQLFWLCGPCSERLTLECQAGLGVVPVPLSRLRRRNIA